MKLIATIIAATLASTAIAVAQTPAAGGGNAAAATVGSDVKDADNARRGTTTGTSTSSSVATEQPGVTPRSPTGAPVPNAAVSKPPADEAAPAGR